MDEEETPSVLVVVVDADPKSWRFIQALGDRARSGDTEVPQEAKALTTLPHLLDSLLLFIDAFLLMHRSNRVAVLAATPDRSDFLFPVPAECETHGVQAPHEAAAGATLSNRVGTAVVEGMRRLEGRMAKGLDGTAGNGHADGALGKRKGSLITQALSKGLCYVQRVLREAPQYAARALILQASSDVHGDYNAMMNCIFSAHRSSVPVDCCVLGVKDSSFLQQASHITGGIYCRPEHEGSLLQYFIFLFLPSASTRTVLRLPRQEIVDFRAACFCHKKAVEQAFVCSVCLSIFCTVSSECPTCGSPCRPPRQARKLQTTR